MDATLPTEWANYLSMAGFIVLAVLVWAIPKHLVLAESPDTRRWRDLRLWASVLISVQLVLYVLFS